MDNFIDIKVKFKKQNETEMSDVILKIRPEIIIAYSNEAKQIYTTCGAWVLADDYMVSDEILSKTESTISAVNKYINFILKNDWERPKFEGKEIRI